MTYFVEKYYASRPSERWGPVSSVTTLYSKLANHRRQTTLGPSARWDDMEGGLS